MSTNLIYQKIETTTLDPVGRLRKPDRLASLSSRKLSEASRKLSESPRKLSESPRKLSEAPRKLLDLSPYSPAFNSVSSTRSPPFRPIFAGNQIFMRLFKNNNCFFLFF